MVFLVFPYSLHVLFFVDIVKAMQGPARHERVDGTWRQEVTKPSDLANAIELVKPTVVDDLSATLPSTCCGATSGTASGVELSCSAPDVL